MGSVRGPLRLRGGCGRRVAPPGSPGCASRADSLRGLEPDAAEPPKRADVPDRQWEPSTPLEALTSRGHPEVVLAATAMSLLRGLVGFTTFLLAFELARGEGGHMVVRLHARSLDDRRRRGGASRAAGEEARGRAADAGAVRMVGRPGRSGLQPSSGGRVVQGALAFVLGVSAAAAKPAFDALVQRYVPPAAQGRAFARFETRLQLVWVIGALLPVIAAMPFVAGDIVIAAVASVAAATYMTGRQALRPPLGPERSGGAGGRRANGANGTRSDSAEAPLERVHLLGRAAGSLDSN